MDDLISRQAAIDAVEHITSSMSICLNRDECHGMKRMQRQAVLELANMPSAQQWIPCSERLPEEDHWLGGSGRQFSEEVMVTIVNHSDEDTWVDMTQTIDGEWACELPKYCEIVAWMPLPKPWKGGQP